MKFRHSEPTRPHLIHSKEVVTEEPAQDTGFSPDRDIPPEVRKAIFKALDVFAERKMWLEYVVLFNRLEILFPAMDGREKAVIPETELKIEWNDHLRSSASSDSKIILWESTSGGRRTTSPAAVTIELKTFGLTTDTLFTPELKKEFLTDCDKAFERWRTDFAENALIAVRLGLFKKVNAFKHPDTAWERLTDLMKPQEMDMLRIESIALAKTLFPEQAVEVSPKMITSVRNTAILEMRGVGPLQSADSFVSLLLATADSVDLDEKGKLIIHQSRKPVMENRPGLPLRTTI